jgi:hypothetical protein
MLLHRPCIRASAERPASQTTPPVSRRYVGVGEGSRVCEGVCVRERETHAPFVLVASHHHHSDPPTIHAPTHTNISAALSSALLAAGAALSLASPRPAAARNAEAAAAAAAARKAALKAAVENAKASGRDAGEPEAFQSAASVPEDHSPNSHSHQEEGARTSGSA